MFFRLAVKKILRKILNLWAFLFRLSESAILWAMTIGVFFGSNVLIFAYN